MASMKRPTQQIQKLIQNVHEAKLRGMIEEYKLTETGIAILLPQHPNNMKLRKQIKDNLLREFPEIENIWCVGRGPLNSNQLFIMCY